MVRVSSAPPTRLAVVNLALPEGETSVAQSCSADVGAFRVGTIRSRPASAAAVLKSAASPPRLTTVSIGFNCSSGRIGAGDSDGRSDDESSSAGTRDATDGQRLPNSSQHLDEAHMSDDVSDDDQHSSPLRSRVDTSQVEAGRPWSVFSYQPPARAVPTMRPVSSSPILHRRRSRSHSSLITPVPMPVASPSSRVTQSNGGAELLAGPRQMPNHRAHTKRDKKAAACGSFAAAPLHTCDASTGTRPTYHVSKWQHTHYVQRVSIFNGLRPSLDWTRVPIGFHGALLDHASVGGPFTTGGDASNHASPRRAPAGPTGPTGGITPMITPCRQVVSVGQGEPRWTRKTSLAPRLVCPLDSGLMDLPTHASQRPRVAPGHLQRMARVDELRLRSI